jgi:(p)ppGpp synthase/HD superfamily hydrolase
MTSLDPATISNAVQYAAEAHATQGRKRTPGDPRTPIPYLSHLLGVASIVIEDGGSTEDVVAGLLHDVIEDQNDQGSRPGEIESLFGAEVLAIVESCSAPKAEDPGMADFRTRKQVYLDHLAAERNPATIRVSLADKVHNARCTVNDLESDGTSMWLRFNAGGVDQLWWFESLAAVHGSHAAAGRADAARAAELARLVQRMKELS